MFGSIKKISGLLESAYDKRGAAVVDAHIHIARTNGHFTGEAGVKAAFKSYLALGITSLRDGGDSGLTGVYARAIAEEMAIEYKTPIYALTKRGGYGGFIGKEVSGISEIQGELNRLMEYKPDFIKVIQSGIVSFDSFGEISQGGFDKDELEYICSFASDKGLGVMAHCNGARNIELAVSLGVSSIEHGYFMEPEQLSELTVRGVIWTPTFVPLYNFAKSAMCRGEQKCVIEKTLSGHYELFKRACGGGVLLALGSDAGAACVPHGQGALDELVIFEALGMSHEEALRRMREGGAFALDI